MCLCVCLHRHHRAAHSPFRRQGGMSPARLNHSSHAFQRTHMHARTRKCARTCRSSRVVKSAAATTDQMPQQPCTATASGSSHARMHTHAHAPRLRARAHAHTHTHVRASCLQACDTPTTSSSLSLCTNTQELAICTPPPITPARMRVCMRAQLCARVRARMRARVCACVRACMRVCTVQ